MSNKTIQGVAVPRFDSVFKLKPLSQRLLLAHAAVLGAVICAPLQAGAATEQEAAQLAPMVITGVAQQSPIKVVTDPRIPRQPVPASDGADYLKTIPGFSAMRSGGVNGDPVFRGMFGSRVKLLTNGGEMVGACPNRMDSPSSYISPESYDELTVIKGPQTVLWGAGSSAATVLFERGPENFDEPDYRLNGSLLVGSNRRFDRSIDGAVGSKEGYVRVLANASKAHDYNDGNGDRVPSRWNKWNTEAALGWTPTDDTLLELTVGSGDGESRYGGRGMDGTQFRRESVALRFKQENITDTWATLEAQLYYNYADHIMDNYKLRSIAKPAMATQVDTRTMGGRIKGTWQWDDFELVAGVDGQTSEHRLRPRTGGMTRSNPVKDAEFNQWGVFGELTWTLTDNDRVISGLRVDRHKVDDHRDYLAMRRLIPTRTAANCTAPSCVPNPTANKSRTETLPSAFVRYENDLQAIPATVYIGLGHAQRIPDYWELFSAAGADGTWVGTPSAFVSANPEKTTQVDFGIQYSHGPLDAWASAYVGQVRDYLMFDHTKVKPQDNPKVDNIDARIMGGEFGAAYQFTSNVKGDVSLAYAYGKNSSDGRAMPQIPPLEARFGLSYEQGDFSSAALWRVVAAQNRTDEGRGNVIGKDFGPSSGFGVFSLNSAYRLSKNWKVSAGVDNLFDKKYSEHLNLAGSSDFGFGDDPIRINEPGRTWWTRVDMSF